MALLSPLTEKSRKTKNMKIKPDEVSLGRLHNHLLSAVAPRPIAFASTVDKDGNRNLSPFSYFNVFSTRPPIAIFSPAKDAAENQIVKTKPALKPIAISLAIKIIPIDEVIVCTSIKAL